MIYEKKENKPIFMKAKFTGLHRDARLTSISFIGLNEKEKLIIDIKDTDITKASSYMLKRDMKFVKEETSHRFIEKKSKRKVDYHAIPLKEAKGVIIDWLKKLNCTIEIWSDTAAHDWILLQDIFGHSFDMPETIYYIPFDISTLLKANNINPDINRQKFIEDDSDDKYNSFGYANIIRKIYIKLTTKESKSNNTSTKNDKKLPRCTYGSRTRKKGTRSQYRNTEILR